METPYLDRREPVPNAKPKRRAPRLIAGALLGAALELAALRYGWFDRLGAIGLAFLPCYYVIVAIHEAGHLVAARAVGFSWREFSAGPLVVRREANGIRWRIVPSRMLAGGQVQAAPEDAVDLRRRFLILLAGGPIATAIVYLVGAFLPNGAWAEALLFANTLAAATSWIPYYAGGYVTDAKGILLLARGEPEGDRLLSILYVMALDSQSVRPRDWPADAVASLKAGAGTRLGAACSILDIAHALDLEDPVSITAAVERALPEASRGIPLHRRMIFESAAYVQGIYRRNAVLANAWFDEARNVKGIVAEADWDADCRGAIALAEGRLRDAEVEFQRALDRLDRVPGRSGTVEASRKRILRLLDADGLAIGR